MKKSFALVLDRYEGITKKAADMLAGTISTYLGYEVLPVLTYDKMPESMLSERTVIAMGNAAHPIISKCITNGLISVPKKAEGYSVYVGENPLAEDSEIVLLAGNDENGVLYACADFCNNYITILNDKGYIFETGHYDDIFKKDLLPRPNLYALSKVKF